MRRGEKDRLAGFVALLLMEELPYNKVANLVERLNGGEATPAKVNFGVWVIADALATEIVEG